MSKTLSKSFFIFTVLFATSISGFAEDDSSIARGGGGHTGVHGGNFGEHGNDHRGNFDRRGDWGRGYGDWGGGYVAPAYPDYPYYLPPPTPAEAFPDDASQDSLYKRNQHPPIPR